MRGFRTLAVVTSRGKVRPIAVLRRDDQAEERFLSSRVAPAQQSSPQLSSEQIAQIVASPDRSEADRTSDLRREPEQMLSLIGIRPGIVALDLTAAGGYTTEF